MLLGPARLPFSLGRSTLFALATMAVASVVGGGCGGCNEPSSLVCDANGDCQICDGYGCRPADGTSGGGANGQGASTSTSTGAGGETTTSSSSEGGAGGDGAGGAACDPAVVTCPCDTSDDCTAEGTQCIAGLCIVGCELSYQCGSGKVCKNGACVTGCDQDTPCDAGYACDKGTCVVDPENPECDGDTPCTGVGQQCIGGLCATPCTEIGDCTDGQICDGGSGTCIDDPAPQPVCAVDQPCTGIGQQCGDDGYCHYPCSSVGECQLIANQFVACDAGICKTQAEVDPECTLDNPCPAGQDCISNQCL